MMTAIQPAHRRAISTFLLTLWLACAGAPLFSATLATAPACGAKCCRSKQQGCCRKSASSGAAATMRAWHCPPGCGQLPAVAGGTMLALAPHQNAGPRAAAHSAVPPAAPGPFRTNPGPFALFGRPPPRLLLAL